MIAVTLFFLRNPPVTTVPLSQPSSLRNHLHVQQELHTRQDNVAQAQQVPSLDVAQAQPAASLDVAQPVSAAVTEPSAPSVMFWNINMAAKPRVLAGIGQLLRSRNPTVVGFCEVKWSTSDIAEVAAAWGYPHQLLLDTSRTHRFNLALISKHPLIRLSEAKPGGEPFFHGALCALVAAHERMVVCVTHLTPHTPYKRLAEARALRRTVIPAALAAALSYISRRSSSALSGRACNHTSLPPLLLLGDLNALSARDAPAHERGGLADRLSKTRTWPKFSVDERLDYSVLNALTRGDVAIRSRDKNEAAAEGCPLVDVQSEADVDAGTSSVPTTRGGDPRHAAPMRLDYGLANHALVRRCPGATSRVLRASEIGAGALSDHYPVEVTLCTSMIAQTDQSAGTFADAADAKLARDPSKVRANEASRGRTKTLRAAAAFATAAAAAADYGLLTAPKTLIKCRALSGLAAAVHDHRARSSAEPEAAAAAPAGGSLGRCAIVGSSGQLLEGDVDHGEEIDSFDVVIRLNAAPVVGFEERVGRTTSVRLVNAPQSSTWGRELRAAAAAATAPQLPSPVSRGELLLVSGSVAAWDGVKPAHGLSVHALNRTYRKHCIVPLVFSAEDRQAHTKRHKNSLTPTFGLEAVIHAIHGCSSVDVYGFGVPRSELRESERDELDAAEQRLRLPQEAEAERTEPFRYHYWERRTLDAAAEEKDKPWTYKSHNFALERARLRHMHAAGLLRLH